MFHPRKMKTFFLRNGCPVLEACLIRFGWVDFAVHHWGTSFGHTCVPADNDTICRVRERPANLKSVEWAIRFDNTRWLVLSLSKRCISKATLMKVSSAESPPGFRSPQFDCVSRCARARWALPVLPVCLQVVRKVCPEKSIWLLKLGWTRLTDWWPLQARALWGVVRVAAASMALTGGLWFCDMQSDFFRTAAVGWGCEGLMLLYCFGNWRKTRNLRLFEFSALVSTFKENTTSCNRKYFVHLFSTNLINHGERQVSKEIKVINVAAVQERASLSGC